MRPPWTPSFEEEVERFRFCYQCDDCVHFMVSEGACAHEWPTEDHRRAPGKGPRAEIVFCKEFELLA